MWDWKNKKQREREENWGNDVKPINENSLPAWSFPLDLDHRAGEITSCIILLCTAESRRVCAMEVWVGVGVSVHQRSISESHYPFRPWLQIQG